MKRPARSHPKPPSPTSPSASRAFPSFQSFVLVVCIVRRARTLKAAIVAPSRLVKADVADRVAELIQRKRFRARPRMSGNSITHTILYFEPSEWFINKTPRIITRHFGQRVTTQRVEIVVSFWTTWTTRLERAREKETRTSVDARRE